MNSKEEFQQALLQTLTKKIEPRIPKISTNFNGNLGAEVVRIEVNMRAIEIALNSNSMNLNEYQ